jgi:hypothetical protein
MGSSGAVREPPFAWGGKHRDIQALPVAGKAKEAWSADQHPPVPGNGKAFAIQEDVVPAVVLQGHPEASGKAMDHLPGQIGIDLDGSLPDLGET